MQVIRLESLRERYLKDVRRTLFSHPRHIPTCYLYMDQGAELFEQLCRHPGYTLYGEESRLIERLADKPFSTGVRDTQVIELGGGDSQKIAPLLRTLLGHAAITYTCIDLSEGMIQLCLRTISQKFPQLPSKGIVSGFSNGISFLADIDHASRLFLLLGNTISNFPPPELQELLDAIRQAMGPSCRFVLGVAVGTTPSDDNIYSQSADLFVQFIKNSLHILAAITNAQIDPDAFDVEVGYGPHVRAYSSELVSVHGQTMTLPALNAELELQQGERITVGRSYLRTENEIVQLFVASGFKVVKSLSSMQNGSCVFIFKRDEP